MKVTIVGAGNVGASCAEYIAIKSIASEVLLLDIKDGFAEGKALDLMQTATTLGFNSRVKGVTNDYSATKDSDVVVITSGVPRKPGMTREELIGINAGIVQSVASSILESFAQYRYRSGFQSYGYHDLFDTQGDGIVQKSCDWYGRSFGQLQV